MGRKSRGVQADLELFQAIALSLATEELQQGLSIILDLALEHATEVGEENWDLLKTMDYDSYERACVAAAAAWIKRVTGISYDIPMVTRFDKRKSSPPDINSIQEG